MDSSSTPVLDDSYVELPQQRIVSGPKFALLCVLTLNLYALWWQYKTWRFFKYYEQEDTWPAMRALFSIFTITSLLRRVKQLSEQAGQRPGYSPGLMAAGYIVLILLARLPDPFWLISVLSGLFLAPAVEAFNLALLAEGGAVEQKGFSGRQVALLVGFGLFWILLLYGLTLPETYE